MSEFSREKKYAQLREELTNDNESEVKSEALAPYADRLSRIDSKFQPMEIQSTGHSPLHLRNAAYAPIEQPISFEESTFNNDYLDQFIEEVKQYNLRKGYRKDDDTKRELITKITDKNPEEVLKTEAPVEFAESSEDEQTISMQVMQLVSEDDFEDEVAVTSDFSLMSNEFLQKTEELNLKLETYQHDLTEVNQRVINTNRLLNFLIALLILGLIVVMGVVIYWIMLVRGII